MKKSSEYDTDNMEELLKLKAVKDGKRKAQKRQKDEKAELVGTRPFPLLYDEGKAIIERICPVKLIPSHSTDGVCSHLLFRVEKPEAHPGLNYPRDFRYFRLMDKEEYSDFICHWETIADEMQLDTIKFWMPMFFPTGSRSPLENYTATLMRIHGAYDKQYGSRAYELGISFQPSTLNGEIPLAFVPEKDWFDARFHEIEPKDIFTLFPEPEMQILMTCIGRAAVGRPKSLPVGWDEVIDHTFRTMAIVYGVDTGTGKSILMTFFADALKSVGYQVAEFNTLGDRFNLGPIMAAHVAYKDDMVSESLEKTLLSDRTKTLITNGRQLVEDKHTNAYTQASHCMVMTNVNKWNPNITYKLDDGILDRIALLKTLYRKDLDALLEKVEGASEGTPSLLTWIHIKYLADKYETTEIAIILWAIRLCADKFWHLISTGDRYANKLEEDMKYWTSRLSETFKPSIERNVIMFMHFSKAVRADDLTKFRVPEMSAVALKECFRAMHFIFIDPRAHQVRELVKQDWEEKERPKIHPWQAIRNLDKQSVDGAWRKIVKIVQENPGNVWTDRGNLIKEVFGTMSLRNGFKLGTGVVHIVMDWNDSAKVYIEDIIELAVKVRNSIRCDFPEIWEMLLAEETTVTESDHLYEFQYDPDEYSRRTRQREIDS